MNGQAEVSVALGDKLKELRLQRGLTQEELEERSSVSQGTISGLESGRQERTSYENMRKLADALEVSVNVFLRAAGLMDEEPSQTFELSEDERRALELGRQMLELVERQRPRRARAVPAGDVVRLPVRDAIAADRADRQDGQVEDTVEVPRWMVAGAGEPVVFRVAGDCLRDLGIWRGDLLIVDTANREPQQGEVVAVSLNGEETAKCFYRVGDRVELRPASPGYKTIMVTDQDELEIIGVYVTYLPTAKRGQRGGGQPMAR